MEPTAVMIHDSNETAPNWAMLDGNMMMPEPIILTDTRVVSPTRLIFLLDSAIDLSLFFAWHWRGQQPRLPARSG